MIEANEKFRNHRPRKGDAVTYHGRPVGTVQSVEGNLCYVDYPSGVAPFIWAFQDGVNAFHDWPSRSGATMAQHGGIDTIGKVAP